jgi:YebC/PmpR family DNA-binding regulatory protein
MSGHSKWHQIRHKKAKEDAKRGQIFSKLARYITVAAKEGGGNPELNPTLATAIEKAKSYNMPQENIERAIKRGTGEIAGAQYEQITYEGYGPEGVAVLVEVTTDNRNRTAAEMRHIFSRHQGKLAASGAVAWLFERKGVILVPKEQMAEEKLLELSLEAGAEDMRLVDSDYEIITEPTQLAATKAELEKQGVKPVSAEILMYPKNTVALDKEGAKKVLKLVEALEENDDVQEVYANFDIPESVMQELE